MRAPSPQRGVTLVELLITIVLAGIAFAALVPVFVAAAQQSTNDQGRILATNNAQSAVERLRDLPYDDLQGTDWASATTRAQVLGQSLQWRGAASNLTVAIDPYPAGSAKGTEKYLVATVTASWQSSGGHPRSVVMKTAIYREGLGTETLVLYVSPLTGGVIRQSPVTVTSRLGSADAAKTERIEFTVYANNGTLVDSWSVATDDAVTHTDGFTYYDHAWATDTLQDGRYSFVAKTVPLVMDPQPPAEWARKEYILDRDPPSNQNLVTCEAGFQAPASGTTYSPFVYVAWRPATSQSDIDHFEISRTGVAADGSPLPDALVTVPNWSMEYVDRTVQVGATYTYAVRGWDTQERYGEWTPQPLSAEVTPYVSHIDPQRPPLPITYSVSGRSVTVTWQPSTTPTLTDTYRLYRQGSDGVRLLVATVDADSVSNGVYTYTDPFVDYGATYTYFVTSLVLTAAPPEWESLSLSGAPVRVPEPPKVGMMIDVVTKAGVTVPKLARLVIHDLDNGDMIPANPWDYPEINPSSKNASQNTWVTGNILYPGNYEVMAIIYDQNRNVIANCVSQSIQLSQSDTLVHVPYDGPN